MLYSQATAEYDFTICLPLEPSHQASNLAAAVQFRRADLDARLRSGPRKHLHNPLVPDLRVVRLPPHADLQLRVLREVEWGL